MTDHRELATEVFFVLSGEFTTLNKHLAATNTHRQTGASVKKKETWRVHCDILRLFGSDARVLDEAYPLHVICSWYTKNERTDPDNTAYAIKYLLDGMQSAGLIRNDSRKEIASITHYFFTDKQRPRVEVTLKTETL